MTHTPQNPTISVKNLFHAYGTGDGRRDVLKNVHLSVMPGEMVILSGPSGSGKTTLLTLLGALRTPQRGEISVLGQDLMTTPQDQSTILRRRIGFIFQQHNLLKFLTSAENIMMAMGHDRAGITRQDALALLSQVGLGDKANSNVGELSVGQKQRVSIARALVHHPDLILADEPTASLDWQSAQDMMALFRDKTRNEGKSALIVSHDNRLFNYADRTVRILDGGIAAES